MKFSRYPEYKDSGVEWLGEVPAEWEIAPLKHSLVLVTDKAEQRTNPVALENIDGWSGRYIPTETEFQGEGVAFETGDILFGKLRPYLAKVLLADRAGQAVGDFHVLRPATAVVPHFAQLQMLTRAFIDTVDGSTFGSKMPRASWEFLGTMPFILPPVEEQTAITTFLDRETGKIDALVAEQEKLIALLKEKRQVLISHAVTKGLNPDAPMKPSGIDWLGDVPAHWNIVPMYLRYSVELGKMLDTNRITGDSLIRYLRNVDVQWGTVNTAELPEMDIHPSERDRYAVRNGDLLVCEGGEVGRAAIVQGITDTIGYQKALHRLRPLCGGEVPSYMYYTLVWAASTNVFGIEDQSTISHLTGEQLRKYRFPRPPTEEQTLIASCLGVATEKLDELIAEVTRTIALLNERRTAMISAAVTGKIDVRGAPSIDHATEDTVA